MELRANRDNLSPLTKATALSPGAGRRPSSDATVSNPTVTASPKILVVEDQEDVRRMVATALEIEGYEVDEAANAHEGLRHLERKNYQLVLSDYAMPGGTGTWMLKEADRRGLMHEAAAVIVTAHPDVSELAGVAVINKPLDLDSFLDQVRKLVYPADACNESRAVQHRLELVLYISSRSPASMRARKNLNRALEKIDKSHVKLSIVDLVDRPLAGETDGITFTPTLVRHRPGPRMWIVGSLNDSRALSDLIRTSGLADG